MDLDEFLEELTRAMTEPISAEDIKTLETTYRGWLPSPPVEAVC